MAGGEQLSNLTTFRIGGPCARFFDCRTIDELRQAIREAGPRFLLIGGGSNLLASDDGVSAPVIRFRSDKPDIRREGEVMIVSGATLLDDLARYTVEEGLEGLVCCTGIPGTVGGAVAGNAGAFGEQIGDRVTEAIAVNIRGEAAVRAAVSMNFAYRRSGWQDADDVVASVTLRLRRGDRKRLAERREEILEIRASKHPDWRVTPTAGSFFKNIEPTSKAERRQAAGWFLEQAGAKDMRAGGARTYEKHANIVIAEPGCTARDVVALTRRMAAAVREKFGLELQREVRLLGNIAST